MKKFAQGLTAAIFMTSLAAAAAAQQSGAQPTQPSTVDKPAQQKPGVKQDPGSTGAMDNAVGGRATSADDVKRQTEGKPTAAEEAKGATGNAKPDVTKQSPGTVGASPGTTPPANPQR